MFLAFSFTSFIIWSSSMIKRRGIEFSPCLIHCFVTYSYGLLFKVLISFIDPLLQVQGVFNLKFFQRFPYLRSLGTQSKAWLKSIKPAWNYFSFALIFSTLNPHSRYQILSTSIRPKFTLKFFHVTFNFPSNSRFYDSGVHVSYNWE